MVQYITVAVGLLAVLVSPLGYRLGLPLGVAFLCLFAGLVALSVAFVMALVTLLKGSGLGGYGTIVVVLISVTVLSTTAWNVVGVGRSPAIHDITTDLEDPPQFLAVIPLRGPGENSVEHAGPKLATIQARAYPDIKTATVPYGFDMSVKRVLSVVREMGWEIVFVDEENGHVEATDTTFWFGFKDDIVIRVRRLNNTHSLIDLRSGSRVGVGDLGANANRIKAFLSRF